jgi:uncharacterized protein (TIGR03382 family)
MRFTFDQATGGICTGDSGSAVVRRIADTGNLAGIPSALSGDCFSFATAIRMSAVYESFVLPTINGATIEDPTCAQCRDAHVYDGQCTQSQIECFNDSDCSAYLNCRSSCATPACINNCGIVEAAGFALFQQIDACLCDASGPCSTACAGDETCAAEPACWLTSADDTCQTCFEGACCAETTACAIDDICQGCFDTDPTAAECQGSAELDTLMDCLAASCPTECGVTPPDDTSPDAGPVGDVDAGADADPVGDVDAGAASGGGCSAVAPNGGGILLMVLALCSLRVGRRRRRALAR